MHIRIIHQYFRTPEEGGGLRTFYLARELVARGVSVSVITATNQDNASDYEIEGIRVYSLPVYYTNHLGFYSRIHAFIRFVFHSLRLLKKLPRADLNYVLTTPLTTGIIAIGARKLFNQPYIFEVGDLWPSAPIELKVLKNPFIISAARWLERISYANARGLVGLSPPITRYLQKMQPEKPAVTVTNFAPEEFRQCNGGELRKTLGISQDKFLICYTGTIGLANHLEFLVDAMAQIPGHLNAHCLVMGSGAQLEHIKAYSKRRGAPVTFMPHGGQDQVCQALAASQAVYVSFARSEILPTGCPNKFFDGISAGKLIILNFSGWLSDLVNEHRLGFSYDPDIPAMLGEKLAPYVNSPELLTEAGKRGQELAKKKYSPARQVNILLNFLEQC